MMLAAANSSNPGGNWGAPPTSRRCPSPGEVLPMPALLGGDELPAEVLRDFAVHSPSLIRRSRIKAGLVRSCSSPKSTSILEVKGMVNGSGDGVGATDATSPNMAAGLPNRGAAPSHTAGSPNLCMFEP